MRCMASAGSFRASGTLTYLLAHLLARPLTCSLTCLLTCLLTDWPTDLRTDWPTYSLAQVRGIGGLVKSRPLH